MRFVGCLVEVSLLVALLRSNLSRRNATYESGDNRGASYNNSNERGSISLEMGTYMDRRSVSVGERGNLRGCWDLERQR